MHAIAADAVGAAVDVCIDASGHVYIMMLRRPV
jgi:hypothetical protein